MNGNKLSRGWIELAPTWIKETRDGRDPTRNGLLDKPMLNEGGRDH